MACAILATDPSLRGGLDPETESRRAQVENACRLLQKAGEKSAMASGMVKRLVSVLRKHRVQGLEVLASAATTVPRSEQQQRQQAPPPPQPHQQQQQQQQMPPGIQRQATADTYPPLALTGAGKDRAPTAAPQATWGYDATMNSVGLTGIWNDFLCTNPTNDGWGQLFADLDYMSYGM